MAEIGKGAKTELFIRIIKPLPMQLGVMDYETEAMLREDMRKTKRIDPIWVRKLTPEEKEECKARYPQAEYEVIDGNKRFRNAELLQWETIPAIVLDVSREEAYEIAYRKNKERGKIDPMLEALYFKHLYIEKKLPAFKIAELFNISEKYVHKVMKRVRIQPEAARELVKQTAIAKSLTGKHLEAIASTPPEKQLPLTKKVIEEHLSAKEAKMVAEAVAKKPAILELPKPKLVEEAKKITTPPPPPPPKPEEIAYEKAMEAKQYYPATMVGYIYERYKGEHFQDVLKAATWLLWSKLTEEEREKNTAEAIKLGSRGFKEPISG